MSQWLILLLTLLSKVSLFTRDISIILGEKNVGIVIHLIWGNKLSPLLSYTMRLKNMMIIHYCFTILNTSNVKHMHPLIMILMTRLKANNAETCSCDIKTFWTSTENRSIYIHKPFNWFQFQLVGYQFVRTMNLSNSRIKQGS